MTPSVFHKWVNNYGNSGSFKAKDNLTAEQLALQKLGKENRQLQMENDILKQAALIMVRK